MCSQVAGSASSSLANSTLASGIQAQAISLEQSLRDELAQLRASTPSVGRSLNIAALIRQERDGR